jgi:hypothetical protein
VSLSCARGLEGAGADEGAGTWDGGTVGAVVGAISVLGTTGSVASAFVATGEPAYTNTMKATAPIRPIHAMSDHNPLVIDDAVIRDRLSRVQGTENDEHKSRAET